MSVDDEKRINVESLVVPIIEATKNKISFLRKQAVLRLFIDTTNQRVLKMKGSHLFTLCDRLRDFYVKESDSKENVYEIALNLKDMLLNMYDSVNKEKDIIKRLNLVLKNFIEKIDLIIKNIAFLMEEAKKESVLDLRFVNLCSACICQLSTTKCEMFKRLQGFDEDHYEGIELLKKEIWNACLILKVPDRVANELPKFVFFD